MLALRWLHTEMRSLTIPSQRRAPPGLEAGAASRLQSDERQSLGPSTRGALTTQAEQSISDLAVIVIGCEAPIRNSHVPREVLAKLRHELTRSDARLLSSHGTDGHVLLSIGLAGSRDRLSLGRPPESRCQ